MTVSNRRMTLGSGYKYLMSSVAQSDGASQHASALTRYYAESGTPPGRFIGHGLAGLGHGMGIEHGTQVLRGEAHRYRWAIHEPARACGGAVLRREEPGAGAATAFLNVMPRDRRSTSLTASCSVLYGHMRKPPSAGPSTVLWIAMMAFRPASLLWQKTTSS